VFTDHTSDLAEGLGVSLNICKQSAEYVLNDFKPLNNRLIDSWSCLSPKTTQDQASLNVYFIRQFVNLFESCVLAISSSETLLLVGKTGCGKTCLVQYIAAAAVRKLHVINMSQQTDGIDLFCDFRPVDFKLQIAPIKESFEHLFAATFSLSQNEAFLSQLQLTFAARKWAALLTAIQHVASNAIAPDHAKRLTSDLKAKWGKLLAECHSCSEKLKAFEQSATSLPFAFVEGVLVEAVRNGEWLLLDELNLAPPETLTMTL
jgi:midasin